jgi:hypothetical protein
MCAQIITTTDKLVFVFNFGQDIGINFDKDNMAGFIYNSELLEKLYQVKDMFTIIDKKNIAPAAAQTDAYIYLYNLDIIVRINKDQLEKFLNAIDETNYVVFKPTQLSEEEFKYFIQFTRGNLKQKISKIVCSELHPYQQLPTHQETEEIIEHGINFVEGNNEIAKDDKTKILEKIIKPIVNVAGNRISHARMMRRFK